MKLIAFDVDETLECAGGPVSYQCLATLRQAGHIVGLCGNWARAEHEWQLLQSGIIAFVGPMEMSKGAFLRQLSKYVLADDYILVGNIQGVSGASDDQGAARESGYTFIQEKDWRHLLATT